VRGRGAERKVTGVVVAVYAPPLPSQQDVVLGYAGSRRTFGPVGPAIAQEINLHVFGVDDAQLAVGCEIEIALCVCRW
jgi:hypothetical protein